MVEIDEKGRKVCATCEGKGVIGLAVCNVCGGRGVNTF